MGAAASIEGHNSFGKYSIVNEVGSGAFGTVYEATTIFRRRVALKVFETARKDFAEREIRYLAAVQTTHSPYICHMINSFVINNRVAITFPLLYKSVYDVQKEGEFRGYKLRTVQRIAIDVTRALTHLHNIGIAHCDLKPENIMWKTKACQSVQVIDFGLARGVPCGRATYAQSRYYRAPEVVLGLGSDDKMDIWSLGCILPELYTGRVLFKADDEAHLLAYHIALNNGLPGTMRERSLRSRQFFNRVGLGCVADLPLSNTPYGSFVHECLTVEPNMRFHARLALQHEFLNVI